MPADPTSSNRLIQMASTIATSCKAGDFSDEEDQKIIIDAATQMVEAHFSEAEALDFKYRQEAIAKGIEFIELTPAELAANIEAVRATVWPQMEEKIGKVLMDKIRAGAPDPPQ